MQNHYLFVRERIIFKNKHNNKLLLLLLGEERERERNREIVTYVV